MKIAISQSNYIPWKGYFDNIALVDEFVLYDDMQYTKRDWRNRNKIKTPHGLKWLTIPVEVKGKFYQNINKTKISEVSWSIKHLNILKQNYKKARCYNDVIDFIESMYLSATQVTISEINHHFLSHICNYLDIDTKISFSSDYRLLEEGKTERLVDLCKQLNATEYYTGSAAKNYMDESLFTSENIDVKYFDYSNYAEYDQLYDDFEHAVSILDLIFNEGHNAKYYLKHCKK
ncbi:WbqC family protein [Winogradskyella pulchriflava]|uniref:WbqC family protein n=1 Tax=Winogradskyella pulchriflava TaxID=1110688 RepID=A0ABV6QA31_9FLAO